MAHFPPSAHPTNDEEDFSLYSSWVAGLNGFHILCACFFFVSLFSSEGMRRKFQIEFRVSESDPRKKMRIVPERNHNT